MDAKGRLKEKVSRKEITHSTKNREAYNEKLHFSACIKKRRI